MTKRLALCVAAVISGCSGVHSDHFSQSPISVACAREAISSIEGLTVEIKQDRITFSGRRFEGTFFHSEGASFNGYAFDVESVLFFGPEPFDVIHRIEGAVDKKCAAQQGAPGDGPRPAGSARP